MGSHQKSKIMENKKSISKEIEEALVEIGEKIEQLIKHASDVGADAKEEIQRKIEDLQLNKTSLEKEFRKGKQLIEREIKERRGELEPRLQESKFFLKEGIRQFGLALKAFLGSK